jgi:MFS family permease
MLAVLGRRNIAILLAAGLISSFGDLVVAIALPFYVFDLTHSALATGTVFIASTLARLIVGSVAGVFVDRWERKRTMVVADLTRVGLMLLLLAVRSPDTIWIVYLVAFVESSVSRFFEPAKSALIPRLVEARQLSAANALSSVSDNVISLIAPTVGGALLVLVGLSGVVLVDSVSFLASGLLIALITVPTMTREGAGTAAASVVTPAQAWVGVWREWLEGLQFVRKVPALATLFAVMALAMLGQGFLTALNVVFVRTVLHGDARVFGWMVTAAGIGGLVGGVVVGRIGPRLPPARLITLGFAAAGVILVVRSNVPILPLFLILTGLAPVFLTGLSVSVQTLLQGNVPDRYRGRVFGAFGTTNALFLLGSLGLGSTLGGRVGVVATLDVAGILFIIASVTSLLFLPAARSADVPSPSGTQSLPP